MMMMMKGLPPHQHQTRTARVTFTTLISQSMRTTFITDLTEKTLTSSLPLNSWLHLTRQPLGAVERQECSTMHRNKWHSFIIK